MLISTMRLVNMYKLHKKAGCNEPLGLFFCRRFITQYTDDTRRIFHEIDDTVAELLIDTWMIDNQFYDALPPINPEFIQEANL